MKYSPKLKTLYRVNPTRLRARKSKFNPTTLQQNDVNDLRKILPRAPFPLEVDVDLGVEGN
jgi:hypothetical protein